ncbi:MAG: hypothetical protein GX594_07975, partial [Pirellulaceae bacterium]|nr:hypothetical protein [Pirellulaceae bacterium]
MTPLIMLAFVLGTTPADQWPAPVEPIMLSVDLDVGESADVILRDGSKATIKLLDLHETRDDLRGAVRSAIATVEVNGQRATLPAANYALPTVAGGLQIDCAATKGLVRPDWNPWALDKDARLRIWPAGAPWI